MKSAHSGRHPESSLEFSSEIGLPTTASEEGFSLCSWRIPGQKNGKGKLKFEIVTGPLRMGFWIWVNPLIELHGLSTSNHSPSYSTIAKAH